MSSQERQQALPTEKFIDSRYAAAQGRLTEVSRAQYLISRKNPAKTRHMNVVSLMMGEVLERSGFDKHNEADARIIELARVAGQVHDLGKIGQPDSSKLTIAEDNQQTSQHGSVIGRVIRSDGVGIIYGAHSLVLTRGLNQYNSEIVAKVCDWHHARIPEGYTTHTDEAVRTAWGITALLQPLDQYDQLIEGEQQEALDPVAAYNEVFRESLASLPVIAKREINVQAYVRDQLGIVA